MPRGRAALVGPLMLRDCDFTFDSRVKQHLNQLLGRGITLGRSAIVRERSITPVEVRGLAHFRTMRSSFGARRQARKVGQEEDEDMENARPGLGSQDQG